MTETRTDAIVIGAGFIGSSVAAHLRWRGLSVRLLVHGIVTAAKRDGVEVHQGARVTAIEPDGAGWRVRTPIGDFTADVVVNAAGVWSPEIASLVGAELSVMPIAGQMCTTAPRPPFVRSVVAVQIDTRRTTEPACDIRQGYDGRIWLGTTNRPNSKDTTVTEADTQTIRAGVARVFPALDVVIEHAWAGIRPVPVDLLPIYGVM